MGEVTVPRDDQAGSAPNRIPRERERGGANRRDSSRPAARAGPDTGPRVSGAPECIHLHLNHSEKDASHVLHP